PMPAMTYMTPHITRSSQLSPQPQATGAATTTATKGRSTNAQSAIRIPTGCLPSVSGLAPSDVAGAGFSRGGADMTPHRGDGIQYRAGLRLRYRNLRYRKIAGLPLGRLFRYRHSPPASAVDSTTARMWRLETCQPLPGWGRWPVVPDGEVLA